MQLVLERPNGLDRVGGSDISQKCSFSTWHIEGDRGSAVMMAMDLSGTGAGRVLWPPQLEEVVFSTQRLAMRGKDLRGPFFLQ